jgi:hypothetical protein
MDGAFDSVKQFLFGTSWWSVRSILLVIADPSVALIVPCRFSRPVSQGLASLLC